MCCRDVRLGAERKQSSKELQADFSFLEDWDDITPTPTPLGKGSFARVYLVKAPNASGKKVSYAVKKFNQFYWNQPEDVYRFLAAFSEILVAETLSLKFLVRGLTHVCFPEIPPRIKKRLFELIRQHQRDPQCMLEEFRSILDEVKVSCPDPTVYVVMEYFDSVDLKRFRNDLLSNGHRISFQSLVDITAMCVQAVADLHDADFVHNDVKPENFLVSKLKSGKYLVKMCDYGGMGLSNRQAVPLGFDADYIAPERKDGRLPGTAASDTFSLGVTLGTFVCFVDWKDRHIERKHFLSLIKNMTARFPEERPSLSRLIRESPFFESLITSDLETRAGSYFKRMCKRYDIPYHISSGKTFRGLVDNGDLCGPSVISTKFLCCRVPRSWSLAFCC